MTDVIVVGGGPAGLACALELRRRGVGDVLVVEREAQAGGIPRHSAHQGFGLRDFHRVLSGPRYARRYAERARGAGVEVLEQAMVTGWSADEALEVTSPAGRERMRAPAIVLATGCRERPRSARLVPGSRPEGVMTTGMLQQLALKGMPVGSRALVVGAEHVSFSAVLTLAHAGAKVVGMTTELPRHQTLAPFRVGAALRYRFPLWTRTAITRISGRLRVEEVELLELESSQKRVIACDTVVFTADWIPDHELPVMGGLELDSGTRGPRADTGLRTTRPGIFAAGNVLHGAESADIAALSGRHAARSVARWLAGDASWPAVVPIKCAPPLQWISPNAIGPSADPPRGCFLLRSREFTRRAALEIRQDGRLLWSGRARLTPGRSTLLPCEWLRAVDALGGPVQVSTRAG
ncbi:MAG: FAD-dependent oxidoreductase [Actinobacteria bacterium]|nr:MAG: FAD-dependent oxidoreductase [Actinomycetota bacterium]